MQSPSASGMTWPQLWLRALMFKEVPLLWLYGATAVAWTAAYWTGAQNLAAGLFVGGVYWVLNEYLFHRFLLHMPPPPWAFMRKLHARVHWQHHQTPDRPQWLFVPVWGSAIMVALAALVGWTVGGPALVGPTLVAYCAAFLHYEATHLAAHVPYRPRTRLGAFMKRHHLLHHYKNERYWFGVTNPLMDRLFRTWPRRDDVPKSETARTLGVEPE